MSKMFPDLEHSKANDLKKKLDERHASYILITCSEPSREGDMDVEMIYKGDPALLSLMMDGAKKRLACS